MAELNGLCLRAQFSTIFIIANVALFILGLYLWIAQSAFRILILYSVFNLVLLFLTDRRKGIPNGQTRNSIVGRVFALSAIALAAAVVLPLFGSLYTRPATTGLLFAALVVSFLAIAFSSGNEWTTSLVLGPISLSAIVLFVILYADFSIYLVQPNLMQGVVYAGVDAYRDYTNAARILQLSGFDPQNMIGELYYRIFPVVPIDIAAVSLVTDLPANIAHLIMGITFTVLNVFCAVLMTFFIIDRYRHRRFTAMALLPTVVVLIQPMLLDPLMVLTPLNFSVALLMLVLYLGLSSISRESGWVRSAYVAILLIVLMMIPLHFASVFMITFSFCAIVVATRKHSRSVFLTIATVAPLFLALYITSFGGTALTSISDNLNQIALSIGAMLQTGPAFVSELGVRGTAGPVPVSEATSFVLSFTPALLLAIASTTVLRLMQYNSEELGRKVTNTLQNMKFRPNLSSLWAFCSVVFAIGVGGSYLLHSFGYGPTRYFVLPLTPLAVIATSLVVKWITGNMNRVKQLVLFGLLVFYALSVAASPSFLAESSPLAARMAPTQSERAAASFLASNLQVKNSQTSATEVYTDWPFSEHVRAVLLSENFYGPSVNVPSLLENTVVSGHNTYMLARAYFNQSSFLRQLSSQERVLTDSEKWSDFNRVFDDSSTTIYWNQLGQMYNT